MGTVDAKAGSDRFATCAEVRAALSSLPDLFLETSNENLSEADSALDGRVLLVIEDDEMLKFLERLDMTPN